MADAKLFPQFAVEPNRDSVQQFLSSVAACVPSSAADPGILGCQLWSLLPLAGDETEADLEAGRSTGAGACLF
ncbi:hypothetical protein Q0F98_14295 [Paenibacillus amylolyticus]|nr:hypothetical protein Q0F98_14295 [Paenibacillus amylolyticus]